MNENIFNTLEAIDVVQESALDTQLDVLAACDNAYSKYCMFSESYNGDVDELGFFTEGAIGDEMKKMKKDGEGAVVSILAALPRFIAALIKVITGKTKDAEKNLDKLSKNKGKVAKVVESVLDTPDEKTQKSLLAKIQNIIGKTLIVSLCTTGIAGIVLHFKPKTEEHNGEKMKKTTDVYGFEVCVTKDGKIAMTNEFYDTCHKLFDELTEITTIKNPTEDQVKRCNELKETLARMAVKQAKYDGRDAKEMGLTGLKDIYNRANGMLMNLRGMSEKIGSAAKDKAGDNKVLGVGASVFDHLIRSAAAFVSAIVYGITYIGAGIMKLIGAPISAVISAVTKNPDDKKENKKEDTTGEKPDNSEEDTTDESEKSADDKDKDDSAVEDDSDKVEEESSVDEVPEGETVTQESATVEETETIEPVDPVVSYWYNK